MLITSVIILPILIVVLSLAPVLMLLEAKRKKTAVIIFSAGITLTIAAIIWAIVAGVTIPNVQRGHYSLTTLGGVQVVVIDGETFNITKKFKRLFPEGSTVYVSNTPKKSGGIIWESMNYYLTPVKDGKHLVDTQCFVIYTNGARR